jgi:hypothetical protein
MRRHLVEAAERRGVLRRTEALALAPKHVVADAVTDGALVRVLPGIYASPGSSNCQQVLRPAALALLTDAALSHLEALDVWDLPGAAATPTTDIHLTQSDELGQRRVRGLTIHRQRGFKVGAPLTVVRNGLRVVRLEQSVISSWPLLAEVDRRLPAIVAVRDRKTTAGAEMRALFQLLGLGVQSHLEAWGHAHVFTDKRLPTSRAQVPVTLPNGRRIYLDRLSVISRSATPR